MGGYPCDSMDEQTFDNLSANQKVIQQPPPRPVSAPTETQQSVLTSVQQEMAARRKANISRQDSRLSVKCLIESIENATKQAKAGKRAQDLCFPVVLFSFIQWSHLFL